ncbi:MAG: hypothetical protein APR63_02065 [Desulfuromonas sp. SDB]|nr:MAG: hypothetical protein APR63_02065 [Desulfuromonas sp. SDB]
MLLFKIALRNVLRQKRRTILTMLTMGGGFVLCAASIGWADGAYGDIIYSFTSNQLGQIQIHSEDYLDNPTIYKTIVDYEKVGKQVDSVEGVKNWTPRIYVGALGMVNQEVSGVQVVGIDPLREDSTTNFNNMVTEGEPLPSLPGYDVLIGKGLAKVIKAELGDSLVLLSQGADGSIANAKYGIMGIVESGEMGGDRMNCYIDIRSAQQLFVLDNQCHEIVITVEDISSVNSVTSSLRSTVKSDKLDIQPWMVFAKSFYEAMRADMNGLWIQLGIIILLVAFGVLNTVLMSVLERQREFGLLKAIGTKPGMIIMQILLEMNLIAIFSVVSGSVVALGLLYWLSNYGISLSTPMTFGGVEIQQMKATINLRSFVIPLITVFATTTVVSIFPAVKAARTDPVKTMRTN